VIDRRTFIGSVASGVFAVPLGAFAQEPAKVWRVGMLETTSTTLNAANFASFMQGLRDLGYVEGRNLIIEYRSADGRSERFADLAAELVGLKVNLIVTRGTPASLAAKNATLTIPIVMANAGDPVDSGLVTSLARPGGNVTGLSSLTVNLESKRFGLLREVVPNIARIAALYNMSSPANPPQWKEIETAARAVGVQPSSSMCASPRTLRPHSMRQPGSGPMDSSSAKKVSCKRTEN
jgi:putative ABC transport system substrate-binding protein